MKNCNNCRYIAIWHCFHNNHYAQKMPFTNDAGINCSDWALGEKERYIPNEKSYCPRCKQEVDMNDLVPIAKGIFWCSTCKQLKDIL